MKQFISFIRKEFFHIFRDRRTIDSAGHAHRADNPFRFCHHHRGEERACGGARPVE